MSVCYSCVLLHMPIKESHSQSSIGTSTPEEYRQKVEERTAILSRLDRSMFFRYPKDMDIIESETDRVIAEGRRVTVLEIGIGNLEEPLSYLGCASRAAKRHGKSLNEAVDLTVVEMRQASEINPKIGLGKSAFSSKGGVGMAFLPQELQKTVRMLPVEPSPATKDLFEFSAEDQEYRFRSDIREVLSETLNNPHRAKMGMPVEQFLTVDAGEYDIVACNNVLQHMGGVEGYASPYRNPGKDPTEYSVYIRNVQRLLERVRPGGILVMHTDGSSSTDLKGMATHKATDLIPEFKKQFEEIQFGIYRKLSTI